MITVMLQEPTISVIYGKSKVGGSVTTGFGSHTFSKAHAK